MSRYLDEVLRSSTSPSSDGVSWSTYDDKRRFLYIHVASQCTDCNEVSAIFDVRKILDTTDVDEHRRLGQAKFH